MPRYDQPEEEAEFLTPEEFAKHLHVHGSTVRKWVSDGLLKAIKPAKGSIRIPKSELEKILHPPAEEPQEKKSS